MEMYLREGEITYARCSKLKYDKRSSTDVWLPYTMRGGTIGRKIKMVVTECQISGGGGNKHIHIDGGDTMTR